MVIIELRGSWPRIWRRLTLPGDLTPNSVHTLFQTAVGWTDSHMHECLAKLRPQAPGLKGASLANTTTSTLATTTRSASSGGVRDRRPQRPDAPAQPPYARSAQAQYERSWPPTGRSPWGRFGFHFRPSVNHRRMGTHAQ